MENDVTHFLCVCCNLCFGSRSVSVVFFQLSLDETTPTSVWRKPPGLRSHGHHAHTGHSSRATMGNVNSEGPWVWVEHRGCMMSSWGCICGWFVKQTSGLLPQERDWACDACFKQELLNLCKFISVLWVFYDDLQGKIAVFLNGIWWLSGEQ